MLFIYVPLKISLVVYDFQPGILGGPSPCVGLKEVLETNASECFPGKLLEDVTGEKRLVKENII